MGYTYIYMKWIASSKFQRTGPDRLAYTVHLSIHPGSVYPGVTDADGRCQMQNPF